MLGWKRRTPKKAQRSVRVPISRPGLHEEHWGTAPATGVGGRRYKTADLAYTPIKILSSIGAKSSLAIFNSSGERGHDNIPLDSEKVVHDFLSLWRDPNDMQSSYLFLKALIVTFLTSESGAFIWLSDGTPPTKRGGDLFYNEIESPPTAMYIIKPSGMSVIPDRERYIKEYMYSQGGEKTYFHPSTIVHIRDFDPEDDFGSVSPLEPTSLALMSDRASAESNFAMHVNGLKLSGVIESDEMNIDPDQVDLMTKLFTEKHTGDPRKAHQPAALWAGFSYRDIGTTPREAEFLGANRQNRDRVYAAFSVHPGVLLSEDVNLANAKVAEHVTRLHGVSPILTLISTTINQCILPLYNDPQPVEAHFVGVVPQDEEQMARVEVARAQGEAAKATAVNTLILGLGLEEGIAEAKRKGLISEDVAVVPVSPAPPSANGTGGKAISAAFFREYP